MRLGEREFLGNVLKMSAVAGFLHLFVEVPLHEYGHYWAGSLLGVPMVVDGERTWWATSEMVPPTARAVILLAGGVCAGSLLLALFFLVRRPYRFGILPLVAANFAYAPLDGTALGYDVGLVALVGVWLAIFGVFLARFLGWQRPSARERGRTGIGARTGARGFEPLS